MVDVFESKKHATCRETRPCMRLKTSMRQWRGPC